MSSLNQEPTSTPSKSVSATAPRVTPAPIIETTFAFAQSCALLAAIELNLFTRIAQGKKTVSALAEDTGASASALQRLLGALHAMRYVQQHGDEYVLTPVSDTFLVRSRQAYMGDVALQIRNEWDAWIHLTEVIQTGQSFRRINEETVGGHFFAEMVDHLFQIVYPVMRRLAARLEVGTRLQGLQVLDLGAGSAPSAIAVLEQDPQAHAVAIDFPEVLARTQVYAAQHGVAQRMEYQPADLESVELPAACFDLIFASHTFRVLGMETTQRLIEQSYQALKPGGRLVIVETYNNPEEAEKLFPHIVSLNMLVNTRSGDAFSLQQMRDWVTSAGFQIEVLPNVAPDPVVVAIHP
jgi:ubiquinone/menaquinone biosynthesis C-methylase UbiE